MIKRRIKREIALVKEFIELLKVSLRLLLYNIWVLIPFSLLYIFVTQYIVMPGISILLSFVLSITGLDYIGYNNIFTVLLNPLFDITALLCILILAYFCLFEIVGIIYLVNESHFKRKVSFLGLIVQSAKKSFEIIYPKNWLAIVYVLILMPLTSVGVGQNFISSLSVPGFIEEYIFQVPWMLFLYFAVMLILVLIVYFTFFSFNFFVLENKSFNQSVFESLKLMKQRVFQFKRLQTYWAFVAVLIRLLTVGVVMFIVIFIGGGIIIYALDEGSLSVSLSLVLGCLSIVQALLSTITTVLTVAMTIAFVSSYFFENIGDNYDEHPVQVMKIRFIYFKRSLIVIGTLVLVVAIGMYTLAAYILINYKSYLGTIDGPAVTAHRGASALTPENSRSFLEKAIELGADYVEFDLTETKDGVLVVAHDNDLSARFGSNKVISQSTYDELRDVDIGSSFSPEFSSERLITFEDAIQICNGRIKMNIELKPTSDDHDLVETAVRIFQENNLYEEGFLASTDLETLLKVESLDSTIDTCFDTSIAYGQIQYIPVDYFSVEQTFCTSDLIDIIHNNSKEIFAWTVDKEEDVKRLTDLGINNIVTNDITMAKETIAEAVQLYNSNQEDYAYRYLMSALFDLEIENASLNLNE